LNFWKQKPLTAVLGLSLDGDRLDGVVLRRQDGTLQPAQSFTAALTLDLLTGDPELVGREILNQLEAAGIRERQCVVALPIQWVITAHATIPDLPEADIPSFLQIEAERGFPCDISTLRLVTSRFSTPAGTAHATFMGVPVSHLERLEQVLHAAHLRPLSFSIGTLSLPIEMADCSDGALLLVPSGHHMILQVNCGAGVAALRTLDCMTRTSAGRITVQDEVVARETRITLGQLPPECRAVIKRAQVFGADGFAQEISAAVQASLGALGLQVNVSTHYPAEGRSFQLPSGTAISIPCSLAARYLMEGSSPLEFLLPRIPAWKRILARYASGRLQTALSVTAALIAIVAIAFGVQGLVLAHLTMKWSGMSTKVGELQEIQQHIQQYRPWFDDSFKMLAILRQLSLVFPEDGDVTLRSMEIRDSNTVSCSGTARDHAALLQTLTRLCSASEVHDLKVEQIRGRAPLQFTFGFCYGAEAPHEN